MDGRIVGFFSFPGPVPDNGVLGNGTSQICGHEWHRPYSCATHILIGKSLTKVEFSVDFDPRSTDRLPYSTRPTLAKASASVASQNRRFFLMFHVVPAMK